MSRLPLLMLLWWPVSGNKYIPVLSSISWNALQVRSHQNMTLLTHMLQGKLSGHGEWTAQIILNTVFCESRLNCCNFVNCSISAPDAKIFIFMLSWNLLIVNLSWPKPGFGVPHFTYFHNPRNSSLIYCRICYGLSTVTVIFIQNACLNACTVVFIQTVCLEFRHRYCTYFR